jgi:hypothetical protein
MLREILIDGVRIAICIGIALVVISLIAIKLNGA